MLYPSCTTTLTVVLVLVGLQFFWRVSVLVRFYLMFRMVMFMHIGVMRVRV